MREDQRRRARSLLSRSEFLELVSVLEGIKPGMRLCCTGEQLADITELLGQMGLFASESPYAVENRIATGGVVHTSRLVRRVPGREDLRFVYIGPDRLIIGLLKAFDMKDDRRFGLSLGYPECCVDFFAKTFSTTNCFDLVPKIGLRNARGYNPLLNSACRHFDYRLLSHFPCSWDCEFSDKIARGTLEALRRHDAELARETLYWLETDVVYSPQVVIAVKDSPKKGRALSLRKGAYQVTGKFEADTVSFEKEAALLMKGGQVLVELMPYQWLPFQSERF